ncbi:MAG: prolyl oligopeptidase family serine peptidase [Haloferacaceae archaeon]
MSEPIPLDAYYDLSTITDVALSPSGDRVAFVADEFDPNEDERLSAVFVAPADGSDDPHRLTRASTASSPKWSADGERLGFVAAREEDLGRRTGRDAEAAEGESDEESGDGDGAPAGGEGDDEEPKPQVWYFDLARGGDARQVTDREEGVSEFDWSPDGDRIVVSARDPTDEEREYLEQRREGGPIETQRLQHKVDGAGWLDDVTTYLFVVDVDTGEETRLDDACGGGAFEAVAGMSPSWGAADRIAFTSCRTEDPDDTMVRDVYTVDPDGSDLRELTDSDLWVQTLDWDPSGERLAVTARDPVNWCIPTQVYVVDGDGYESVTGSLDRTVARGARAWWADGETLYTRVGDESRTRLVRVDLDGGPERVFEAQGDDRALAQFALAGDTAAVVLSHPNEGQDVWSVAAADLDAAEEPESLTRLTAVNDDLVSEYPMPEVRRVSWESDGWDVDGVVYLPPGVDPDEDGPLPLVVAIHGGPVSYDEPVFDFTHAAFTSRGYAVFRPNYRGGSSYGRRFCETLHGQWGTVEVDDIVAGVDDLADRGWADPDRVFGHGFSYGGITQGFLVTQTDLLTAAAPEHGIYDLRSAFGTDDSHVWTENEFGLPWEVPETFDAHSSITDVDGLDTPLLVMAGGEDWRCAPSQSEQLYVAARKQGVDAKLVVYPDEHHNVADPDRAIHRLTEITDWYERHDPAVDSAESE